jgi:selenocysteine lyase/cysteine desulfurase
MDGQQVDLTIDALVADESLRRKLFPITGHQTFLAHAGVAPLPRATADTLKQVAEKQTISQEDENFLRHVEAIRKVGARLINASSDEVALLGPTSLGLNLVALGLAWAPGDEVVFYPEDYPANVYPWLALEEKGVVPVRLQPARLGELTPELVLSALTPRTRLVALASCHFLSGYRLDYETIGEELQRRGVLFCLDAIQSLGATTIDVRHVDFLAADSHKWMLGPLGAGIVYVKKRHFQTLRPALVGSWNIRSPGYVAQDRLDHLETAQRYEPGSLNWLALQGMQTSLELILHIGVKQIEARLLDLRGHLEERLVKNGFKVYGYANRRSNKTGITSVAFEDPEIGRKMYQKLLAGGVQASLRQTRGGTSVLRFSPHFYNTEEELDKAVKILLS